MKKESLKKLTNLTLATTLTASPVISPISIYATDAEATDIEKEFSVEIEDSVIETDEGPIEFTNSDIEENILSEELVLNKDPQSNSTQTQTLIEESSSHLNEPIAHSTDRFVLKDWTYSETTQYITLEKYNGTATSLTIPGQYNQKRIRITNIKDVFPDTITKLSFQTTNNEKVLYDSESMYRQFYRMKELTTLDLSGLDTSKVRIMVEVFSGITFKDTLTQLTTLNLQGLNTSNVTSMADMFNGLSSVRELDLSSFDTSKVTDMTGMFRGMSSLTSLDLSTFNTSNVNNMSYMFCDLESLTSLDLKPLNTSKVYNMKSMFEDTKSLTSLDVSSLDTSSVGSMANMFKRMTSLTSLDVTTFDTSRVMDMSDMFYGLSKIKSLDLSHFDTSKVIDMNDMFYGLSNVTNLDLSSFNTSKVTNMNGMFSGASSLISLDLSRFDTSKVTDMRRMFYNNSALTSLDISNFNTSKVTNMTQMFHGAKALTSLDLSHFDTSKVTDMMEMFRGTSGLTSLNLSSFDTSKVTNMQGMFSGASSLISLDLSRFDTSKVTDMSCMFHDNFALTSLDISNFNTSKVKSMYWMFLDAKSLTSLDVSSFDTSNVEDMEYMFGKMSSLTILDLSSFNTSKVEDMSNMFAYSDNLKVIDLSNFDLSAIVDYSGMFKSFGNSTSPLLVITSDETLKNYDFEGSKRPPVQLTLNTNGGKFNDNSTSYTTTGIYTIDSSDEDYIEEVLRELQSEKGSPIHSAYPAFEWVLSSNNSNNKLERIHHQFAGTYLATWGAEFKTFTHDIISISTTLLKGKGEPGAQITAFLKGTQIATTTVDAQGFYQLRLPNQKSGVILKLTQTKPGYVAISKNLKVLDEFKPLTYNLPTPSTTSIQGQGEPGANISLYEGTQLISTTVVDSEGYYELMIPKQSLGTVLTITQIKKDYLDYKKELIVLDEFKNFTLNDVTASSTVISGTADSGATVQAFVNGRAISSTAIVPLNGNYQLAIPKQPYGTIVEVKLIKEGYLPLSKTTTVLAIFNRLTYNEPTVSTTVIKGEGTPGATIIIYKNEERIALTTVTDTGSYQLNIPTQKAGTLIQIKMVKDGYQTLSKTLIVLDEFQTFTIKTTPTSSTTAIYGTGEPGATVGIYTKDGTLLDTYTVNSKGNYKLVIPKQKADTVLTLKQVKSSYLTVSKNITVLNEFKTFTLKTTPTTSTTAIYGTGVVGAKVGIYDKNGKRLAITTVNSKGNYKLVIPKQKVGAALTLKQAKSGYLTASKSITVLDELKTFTLKTTPTTSTTAIYGTGVVGAKVGIYDKNGKRLAITTVNSKGNYKLVIPKQKADTVLTLKQAKSGYLTVSKNITVLNEFKTFSVTTKVNSKTTAIYGKGVAGAKVGIYDKNGKRLAITTVNSKGNYKLVIPKQKAGTKLVLKQAKSSYLTLSKNVTVVKG